MVKEGSQNANIRFVLCTEVLNCLPCIMILISEISNLDFDMSKLVITITQDKGFVPAEIYFTLI